MNKIGKGLKAFASGFKKEKSFEYEISELERKIQAQKVNHILHFLLSIVTAGLWVIVWILVTISASIERNRLNGLLKKMYIEKEQQESKDIKNTNNTSDASISIPDQLIKLSNLLEKGHITEEEFASQKAKILNN